MWSDAPARRVRAEIQLDALGRGDAIAHFFRSRKQGLSISALTQQGPGFAKNAAHESIGKNGFQTVTHLDAIFVVFDGGEQHDALVLALLADAPLAVKGVGDVFDRLAIQGIDADDRHLNASGLLHASAISFQLRARLRVQDVSKVTYVALWFNRIEVESKEGSSESQRDHNRTSE